MEKWLMMLASRRGTAAALPDSKATVESDATVGVTHPSGTLWMLGQFSQQWKQRWFKLESERLFYYTDEQAMLQDLEPQGSAVLRLCCVHELGDRTGKRNCFSLRNTSSNCTLILSCGDDDESPVLLQKWLVSLAVGIENQGGCPKQQQSPLQDECLWQGWVYKKGVNNTAWKKRFIRLTAVSVTYFTDDASKSPQGSFDIEAIISVNQQQDSVAVLPDEGGGAVPVALVNVQVISGRVFELMFQSFDSAVKVHELLLEGSMQRNTAHVTQALSSTGRSVMRFEVQKVVKGGSKTRLLILNVDIRVLIQALPDGSSKYKVSVPDTINAVSAGLENERQITISFKNGALRNQAYVFQSSSERYRFLMLLWPMVPGYSPLRIVDNIATRTRRVASFFSHDPAHLAPSSSSSSSTEASTPENSSLHIFVGTWNHGQYPQDDASTYDIKSWLQPQPVLALSDKPELYVIGSQESNSPGFSQLLQKSLGSDYIQFASAALSLIPTSMMAIFAFVRRDVAIFVANVETCSVPTGIGGVGGNKGGTIVTLTYKHTSIALVNCHLAAGVSHVKNRNRDAMDVLSRASVGRRGISLDTGMDYCFFFGDLNYRVDTLFETAAAAVESQNWDLLWPYDQMRPEQQSGRALHAFGEAPLNFCPSYRWKTGVHELSNKNGQAASWCDRILMHQRQDFASQCLSYTSVPSITTSDHRPVYAVFRIDSPVFDHTKLAPPFRIELFRVSMQLLEASSRMSVVQSSDVTRGSTDVTRDSTFSSPANAAAVFAEDDDRVSQRLTRVTVSESVNRDSNTQSAAPVYTLGIRGAIIEGEPRSTPALTQSPEAFLWPPESIPVLLPFVHQAEFVSRSPLLLSVFNNAAPFAHAELSLAALMADHIIGVYEPRQFDAPLTIGGRLVGYLQGQVSFLVGESRKRASIAPW